MRILRRSHLMLVNLEHIRWLLNIRMNQRRNRQILQMGCLEKGPQDYFKWPETSWHTLGVQMQSRTRQVKSFRYKGRIVVKGYVQIPGIDFTESFALVATDASMRSIFAITLFKWHHQHVKDR